MPQSFADALATGRFLVTTEESMPKGASLDALLSRTDALVGYVDAINLTESSSAVMTMSPVGAVPALIAQGHHPILQITCRDRNRIALQADLLSAAALGVETVVCMAGDPIASGDHPGASGVFDLDTIGLLQAASALNAGRDLGRRELHGKPSFLLGAVCDPNATDIEREVAWMGRKADAGARFFQSQAVYDPAVFEPFMRRAGSIGLPILAGFIVPKSGDMARRLNRDLGLAIPGGLIEALDAAEDRVAVSIDLSAAILRDLAPMCAGIHVIAIGWEQHIPRLLQAAGLRDPH